MLTGHGSRSDKRNIVCMGIPDPHRGSQVQRQGASKAADYLCGKNSTFLTIGTEIRRDTHALQSPVRHGAMGCRTRTTTPGPTREAYRWCCPGSVGKPAPKRRPENQSFLRLK